MPSPASNTTPRDRNCSSAVISPGSYTGATGAPARVSRSSASARVEPGDRVGDRALTFVEAVESFEVTEAVQIGREVEAVAHRLPEMIFGDHRERDPAAVGAREYAVARRNLRLGCVRPRNTLPELVPDHDATTSAIATSMRSPSPVCSFLAHAAAMQNAATEPAARSAIGTRGIAGASPGRGRERAGQRLVVHVVARALDVGSGLPVTRNRAVDDRRIGRAHGVVADPEPLGDTRAPTFAEDVGVRDQFERAAAPLRLYAD